MLEFFIPPAFYLLSKQFSFNTWAFGTGEFDYAFITSVIFICVTAVAAVMVDVQILLKMFVSNSSLGKLLTSKQDVYVMMNWICSFIVMFTLPSVMSNYKASIDDVQNSSDSFDVATNLPALQPATKAGIVLGFSAISYLMGYFGLLLELKHQDHKSKNVDYGAWKQYIPPLFYLIITLFAFRAHSTIAALIASVFFAIYIVNALVTRTQFSLEKLSLKPKAVPPPVQMVTAKTQQNVTCDPSTNPNVANDQALFKLYTSPPGNESKKWLRQIGYDITVYILPLTVVPLAIPILQIPATILCLILTIWKPIYEYAARLIYLQPSKPQEPHRVADRKKSYPAGAEFPRGWFRLLDSSELPRMRVKYIQAMGRDLAIFRGEDGKVRCLDAYCIHLGANMAIGGQVVGNCLECPFHKWSFAGDGMCSAIPYSPAKVPATARTTAYHVIDFYGQICVWFPLKAEETPPSAPLPPPDYFPLPYEKIENGNMVLRGATKLHINMHLQEFAENSTDFAHFAYLHGTMSFPFTLTELPLSVVTINHMPDWKEGTDDLSHMAWFYDKADLNIFGKHSPETGAQAIIHFVGPGGVVYFTFDTPIGSLILFQTNTPVADGMSMDVGFRWYADATMPRLLVWYIVGNWIAQYQNDILIWENKKFTKNPFLVKGDGPMNKQRKWFRQFYELKPGHGHGSTSTPGTSAATATVTPLSAQAVNDW